MSVAAAVQIECLRFATDSFRARNFLAALQRGAREAGLDIAETTSYVGHSPWLVLWGPGAPDRARAIQAHRANGGHAIVWDLAYWSRETKARVSINAAHPQDWLFRKALPTSRLEADPVPVAQAWDPCGPVVVAAIGRKARVQYGQDAVLAWEAAQMAVCHARWPERPIVYRPKHADAPSPPGATRLLNGSIDQALAGASLVITWHSNVAVDAIRNGIPVVCRDGAAAALMPSTVPDDPHPLPRAARDRFLGQLAWFQWAPHEAREAWTFLTELLA